MTAVSVLVPYRGDQGGPRDQAWAYVSQWWGRQYPDYTVIAGTDLDAASGGAWCKAEAVAAALRLAGPDDILVIADADVLCDGVGDAVHAVTSQLAGWAMPHTRVNRLSADASQAVYAGAALPTQPPMRHRQPHQRPRGRSADVIDSYTGMIGGGLVVLPRALYERVPLDPRFVGYGLEDQAWGRALRVLAGPMWRGPGPLWHLWHPSLGTQVGAESPESRALFHRYQRADTVGAMIALLTEPH